MTPVPVGLTVGHKFQNQQQQQQQFFQKMISFFWCFSSLHTNVCDMKGMTVVCAEIPNEGFVEIQDVVGKNGI